MTAPVPNPAPIPPTWGTPLTEQDYSNLLNSWITPEIADAAMIRRVDEQQGREVIGQKGKRDCAGILISYYWPGDIGPMNYRVRRDNPDVTQGSNGQLKLIGKYLGSPGGGNRLYIPVGVTTEQLADPKIPIAIVEGEKKALALWRLAHHESSQPRFIPVAIPGVWSWRGKVGKTGGPNGGWLDVKGPIPDLSRIEWIERTVFIIFDANVHTNEDVKWARKGIARELATRGADVKMVNLPEDCGVNGVDDLLALWGPDKVLGLFETSVSGANLQVVLPPQFQSKPEGMFRTTTKGEQVLQVQLSTYRAKVISNIQLDDGVENKRELEIEAEVLGHRHLFTIPASEFGRMDWPLERMGSAAVTFPNQREYARTAIQCQSMTAAERRIYTHTGWRNIDDKWIFLHAGGAIGETGAITGIEVRLAGALSGYQLKIPTATELQRAVRASLRLAGILSPSISFPLLAATYRAVLGDADFALHLAGETGAFKSELAALHQQHFGPGMDRMHLPGSWSSTGNALEVFAFHAKDALLVVDDFAPQGNPSDVARYHAAADRVFRAAGNQAGRGRLDSTAKLREAKPPRSLILSTGEEIPKGHSIRARLLVLEIAKGAISATELTTCQGHAQEGLYAQSMAGFIQSVAGDLGNIRAAFHRRVSELRVEAMQNAFHARTPNIAANLQAAFECFLDFSVASGAIGIDERQRLAGECWSALREAAAAQAKHQTATEPAARYLEMLRACLSSGRAHLETVTAVMPESSPETCGWRFENQNWKPLGDCIGWVDGDAIYLEPTAAYRVIQMMARDLNEPLAISDQTLRKRISERGLLASVDAGRETLTVRRTIAGSKRSVLHFSRTTIFPEASVGEDNDV